MKGEGKEADGRDRPRYRGREEAWLDGQIGLFSRRMEGIDSDKGKEKRHGQRDRLACLVYISTENKGTTNRLRSKFVLSPTSIRTCSLSCYFYYFEYTDSSKIDEII